MESAEVTAPASRITRGWVAVAASRACRSRSTVFQAKSPHPTTTQPPSTAYCSTIPTEPAAACRKQRLKTSASKRCSPGCCPTLPTREAPGRSSALTPHPYV